MRTLLANDYLDVVFDEAAALVRYRRLCAPFPTVDIAQQSFDETIAAVESLDRRPLRLLMDLRDAPGRNDPAFEEAVSRYRKRLLSHFERRAVVVKSAAGALQLRRLQREHGGNVAEILLDEAEAMRFLTAP